MIILSIPFIFFHSSQFSMKKIGGSKINIVFNGCTTDSGGGGTGESLYTYMDELKLCSDEGYLVGYCCLHTLQLTLSNAMAATIGKGGLEERNAMQAIHSFYDLQDAMEFGLWEKYWKKVAEQMNLKSEKVKKIAAPILTRWWTVGEAAKSILDNLPILLEIAQKVVNANPGNNKLNKIASGILSLMRKPIIVSDIKLISCFHNVFLNHHFEWLQNGDAGVGGTPGFLGRHMLVRYFLMHSDIKKLTNDRWKEAGEKMEPFLKSLDEEGLNIPVDDPADPTRKNKTLGRHIQAKKANMFFKTSLDILTKHYEDAFCNRLLFLSLYGEQCSSKTVARVLLSIQDFSLEGKKFKSEAHGGRIIDIDEFESFLKERIDIQHQMESKNTHMSKLKDYLRGIAGEQWYNGVYFEL